MQLVQQYCSAEVRAVVDFYVNRNAYFANPELMLITMLASEDEDERRFAVKVITTLKYLSCQSGSPFYSNLSQVIREKIRKGESTGDSLPRQFETPSVNFDASSLQTLIDWDTVKLSEPLLTATMSTDEVISCLDSPLQVPSTWSCHSQAMERVVRKVSETCLMVVGEKKREGSGVQMSRGDGLKSQTARMITWHSSRSHWTRLPEGFLTLDAAVKSVTHSSSLCVNSCYTGQMLS